MPPHPSRIRPAARAERSPAAGRLGVLALAALLCACTSPGVDPDSGLVRTGLPGADESVVAVAGSYSFRADDAADREALDLKLEAGHHVAAEHELGAWLLGRYSNVESDAHARSDLWLGVHYRYHFHVGERTSLSLGPALGLARYDLADRGGDAFGYGAVFGLRRWLSSTAALTLSPMVLWTDHAASDGGSEPELLVHFGVAFRL